MKDSECAKLRFVDSCYKPYEYEKWICGVNRMMTATHPELGAYWTRVVETAQSTYFQYLNDVSVTRVSLKPRQVLNRREVESIL